MNSLAIFAGALLLQNAGIEGVLRESISPAYWKLVVEDKSVRVSVRETPIEEKPDGTRLPRQWEKIELTTPRDGWSSAVMLREYNCSSEQVRTIQVSRYARPNLTGFIASDDRTGPWTHVQAGSIEDQLFTAICPASSAPSTYAIDAEIENAFKAAGAEKLYESFKWASPRRIAAGEWTFYDGDSSSITYYKLDARGTGRRVWLRREFKEKQTMGSIEYLSSTSLFEFDSVGKSRGLQLNLYDVNGLAGNVHPFAEATPWQNIAPGTIGARLDKIACALASR